MKNAYCLQLNKKLKNEFTELVDSHHIPRARVRIESGSEQKERSWFNYSVLYFPLYGCDEFAKNYQ